MIRRAAFVFAMLVAIAPPATSARETIQARALTIATTDGPLQADRYTAPGAKARPAIVILHGASGIAPFAAAYIRYARTLAASGFDAYLVSYFSPHANGSRAASDRLEEAPRRAIWRARIGALIGSAKNAPHASGKIGLLGFSLGGQVALSTAAKDERVDSVVVFYGMIPMAEAMYRLPPILVIHGEADRTVPYARGEEIVAYAHRVGATASILGYRGKDHGFDFLGGPAAESAMQQAVAFFRRELHPGTLLP